MLKRVNAYTFLLITLAAISCKPLYNASYTKPQFTDQKSTRTVKKLHKRLNYIAKEGYAVGHQDDMAYGIGWKYDADNNLLKSDPMEITGKYPGVFGFDVAGLENRDSLNIDGIPFADMKELMIQSHKMGGIITVSWHADNPVSGGDSWDPTVAVPQILNNDTIRNKYETWVGHLASFFKKLKYKGKAIPVLFRPWHEMNGSWFWWGGKNCSPKDYVALWKLTVSLLRDKHKVHNLIYIFSPNKLNPEDQYLDYYPGDEYVDILGIDIYDFAGREGYLESVKHDLSIVQQYAEEKKKLYAFTETGLEKIEKPNWFGQLYECIDEFNIAWVLFWRNANTGHHYLPYPGHSSEADFQEFEQQPKTLFLNKVKEIQY